jgi:hypothetical protein
MFAKLVLIVPKRVERALVKRGMAATRHTVIAVAMRAYSIAVAPDWSLRKFFISFT